MEFNFKLTVSGRTVKLKSVNWMEIYYTTAMTSSTKLGVIIFMPYGSLVPRPIIGSGDTQ